jgi:hypothetical protein
MTARIAPANLISFLRAHFGNQDLIILGLFTFFLGFAWFFPLFGDHFFSVIEKTGTRLARRRRLAVIAVAGAVVTLRLGILPIIPTPVPRVGDEFSYLLAGDTFAHGQLTNPPHPMWIFFDTFNVNQHPTYMSKYPPAQGAVLALGEILGHPWIGVLLSCAAMCASMLWALQGWLPARWALLGALMFMFHVGLFSYWMNSYWGGAVAATGGALVTGAFPRIIRSWRPRDALLLGLGVSILANSRPFEGLIFCIPVALGLLYFLWRERKEMWRRWLPGVILPLCIIAALCGSFMVYYNWRGTGDPLLFPYTLNNRDYLSSPVFAWGTASGPQLQYTNPQLAGFYNGWRDTWFQGRINSFRTLSRVAVHVTARVTYFFLLPELCLIAAALFFVFRDRKFRLIAAALFFVFRDKKFRLLFLQLFICLGGLASVVWFLPHYAAPLACVLFVLTTETLRRARHFEVLGRPVGVGFSRVIVLFALISAPFHYRHRIISPPEMDRRAQLSAQLNATPGQHLVIVRYSEEHQLAEEWVYNCADIDHAKIVWAREIPGVDLHPLLRYFASRQVWLVKPDVSSLQLSHYTE